jgi:hypothetical protein
MPILEKHGLVIRQRFFICHRPKTTSGTEVTYDRTHYTSNASLMSAT